MEKLDKLINCGRITACKKRRNYMFKEKKNLFDLRFDSLASFISYLEKPKLIEILSQKFIVKKIIYYLLEQKVIIKL
jgi:hypothetical protein